MMKILNLTQHMATPDQVAAGVVEPADKKSVQSLLTFAAIPTADDIRSRAIQLAQIAEHARYDGCDSAMIAGAGYLMGPLERELLRRGITPLHAFSERVSVETVQADSSVKKENVFRHVGFIRVD